MKDLLDQTIKEDPAVADFLQVLIYFPKFKTNFISCLTEIRIFTKIPIMYKVSSTATVQDMLTRYDVCGVLGGAQYIGGRSGVH